MIRKSESTGNDVVRTEIGESPWTSHHGHGVSSRGRAKEFPALVEIIEGAIDFYKDVRKDPEQVVLQKDAWDSVRDGWNNGT